MSLKIKTLLLFCTLAFCHAAAAQKDNNAANIKEKLAAVNAQIKATAKENSDLKSQLSDLQTQIDELKQESDQKEQEINSLKDKDAGSESDN